MMDTAGDHTTDKDTIATLEQIDSTELNDLINSNHSVNILEVNKTPSKISFTALVVNTEAKEMYDLVHGKANVDVTNMNGDKLKSVGEFKTIVTKLINGVSVVSKTVQLENKNYLDDKKNIKPLELNECEAIANKLGEKGKVVDSVLNKIKKAVDAAEKTIDANAKKYEKEKIDDVKDKTAKVANEIYLAMFNKRSEIIIGTIRNTSTGNAIVATELGRSKFVHIIKESVRLYKKK